MACSRPKAQLTATEQATLLSALRRGNLIYPSSQPGYGGSSGYTCFPEDCQYGCQNFNVGTRAGPVVYERRSLGAQL